MLVDRRRFVKTLLGAGAGLWVPEKTYFFLGDRQLDTYDIWWCLELVPSMARGPYYRILKYRNPPQPKGSGDWYWLEKDGNLNTPPSAGSNTKSVWWPGTGIGSVHSKLDRYPPPCQIFDCLP